MGKRILQLYVDDEDIALAKSKGINLSALFRSWISVELNEAYKGTDKDKIIAELKNKVALLRIELQEKNDEIKTIIKNIGETMPNGKPRFKSLGVFK